ncbi:MAG: Gfo/Idh/MocA family oxidoreductase [Acidobacteria bacterium]|nr:Gfo/Idh/MocA family oxidoreductase [Acidobacteriota bacterium]
MKRRDFLSLAGTAGVISAAPGDRVSVAVIGVNGIGHNHIRNFVKRSDVLIATICDIDQSVAERAGQTVLKATGRTPKLEGDFRRVIEDKSIDAVVIATPHHWHVPMAIRAMQAGKDVYLEKPASHVFREGRLLVDAVRKYNRILQHGTQMRSSEVTAKAGQVLSSGLIGSVRMSKAWNCQRHKHRAPVPDTSAPSGVNYDLWLGPALPKGGFNSNRFHGNWNWYRDFGNGDIGGDGVHDLDMARWGLGVTTHPVRITAHGSRVDSTLTGEREFPDNMTVAYHYEEGKVLLYEDRAWTPYGVYGFDSVNAFYGTEGYMIFTRRGYFQVYLGAKEEKGPGMRGGNGHPEHLYNFIESVRTRKQPAANAEVAHLSCALVHLGEIGYRVGRVLRFDPKSEKFLDDREADSLLTKKYREPWGVPDPV